MKNRTQIILRAVFWRRCGDLNSCAGLKPTYRISSASGISELSGIWWKMREPAGRGKTQCFGRFWEGGEAKKQRFSGREVITAAAKF